MARNGKRVGSAHNMEAVSAVEPVAGLYRMRLRRGAVHSAIRLWHEPSEDDTFGWKATANDEPIAFDRVWPACTRDPIDQAEYDYLMRRLEWGRKHAPDGPQANPHKAVDWLKSPLPF